MLVLDSKGKKFPAKTNASGAATIKGLADGDYTVYAVATGYLPKAGQVTQTGGSGSVTIQLNSGELGSLRPHREATELRRDHRRGDRSQRPRSTRT